MSQVIARADVALNTGIDATVSPEGSLDVLSQLEVNTLRNSSQGGLHEAFRRCALAVLNCGNQLDDAKLILEQFEDFSVRLIQQDRGIKLEIQNAPASAFVDGEMIRGIREHLFAVLRDIVYVNNEINRGDRFEFDTSTGITNAIFHIMRNARLLKAGIEPNIVACWGGHSIDRAEYEYTKEVGYELGLRGLDVCTGCGPGAMKGPMKGAAIGHAKQRIKHGRYLGITEPGIIAAESPNPIVNELVIMPDIEKRLEAFVRASHSIVVFPGGVGTAEEIIYLLGILLHPDNADIPYPLIFTGPAESAEYFDRIDRFIQATLGPRAQGLYEIVIADSQQAAARMKAGIGEVCAYRITNNDAYFFNWLLRIEQEFQTPFAPTHAQMAGLELHPDQPPYLLAANLRRAFSGMVAGNVKEAGIRAIEQYGPFEIRGQAALMKQLDRLLTSFVEQHRMKLSGREYVPCYRLVT